MKFGHGIFYQWALIFLLMVSVSLGCIVWDLVGYDISKDVYSGTYTAIARELTEIQEEINYENESNTLYADINNASATAQQATYEAIMSATIPPPSPPVIVTIEFLSTIIGDGETNYGNLYFHDQNGDVNRLTLDVVSATNFGGADYDPRDYLIAGDSFSGVYQLYIWCEGQQDVTLRATLFDEAGLKSNSVNFSFTCE
jgi:hypothetical protein